jgi:anti-anti-sigma factor
MAFTSTLQMENGIATITLVGELDAAAAPVFRADVERAASLNARRLVLMMQALDYMASAGLRALVFAKQKMGAQVDIYVIGANESVSETLELTGFASSVISMPDYDAAVENV